MSWGLVKSTSGLQSVQGIPAMQDDKASLRVPLLIEMLFLWQLDISCGQRSFHVCHMSLDTSMALPAQEKRRREVALQNLQMAVTAGLPPLGVPQLGLPAPGPGTVRPQLQPNSNMLMEGFQQNLLNQGAPLS